MTSYNNPNQPTQAPVLLRMLHASSGRQGFNEVPNQTGFSSQNYIDPRYAAMINMQTQQAIANSGMPTGIPYQGAAIPQPSSYAYGARHPYAYYPARR